MSSNLIVDVCEIVNILPHTNSDNLEIAIVKGWQCLVKKGQYKKGDKIIFIPPDALIPSELADKLGVRNYLAGSNKDRVKCVRLRGEMSFGLIIDVPADKNWEIGYDCSADLGILKYEPPIRASAGDATNDDPLFDKYTDIENIRNYPTIFSPGEMVVITEKIDGCFRFDQKVMMTNGEQRSFAEIQAGDMILSYDEKNKKFIPAQVDNVIVQKPGQEWLRLKFDNKKDIICTINHLFLTRNRNWVEAKDLEEDDEIVNILE